MRNTRRMLLDQLVRPNLAVSLSVLGAGYWASGVLYEVAMSNAPANLSAAWQAPMRVEPVLQLLAIGAQLYGFGHTIFRLHEYLQHLQGGPRAAAAPAA